MDKKIRQQSENILIAFSLQSPTQASIIKYIFRINKSNILLYLLSLYDIQFKCMSKISIRFFNDREVRAIWDEANSKWWFSAIDIIRAINKEDDYVKAGNYWRWLKKKLTTDGVQLVSTLTSSNSKLLMERKELLTPLITNALKSWPNTIQTTEQTHSLTGLHIVTIQ